MPNPKPSKADEMLAAGIKAQLDSVGARKTAHILWLASQQISKEADAAAAMILKGKPQ